MRAYRFPLGLLALLTLSAGCQLPGSPPEQCTLDVAEPAPIFAIEAPATATANTAFPVKAWVVLYQTVGFNVQTPKPETFKATLDEAQALIKLSGQINSPEANPAANCPFPTVAILPRAEAVEVQLPALEPGTYELQSEHFPQMVPPEVFEGDSAAPSPSPRMTIEIQ